MAFNYRPGDEPVPGYRLERFLGKGAIGEVWQATGPGGTEAALKMVDLAGSTTHARKEFRALQLVKRIHHPNLTPIIAFWAKGEDGSLLKDTDAVQLDSPLTQTTPGAVRETMSVPAELLGPRPKELIIAMGLGHMSLADRLGECQQQGLAGIPLEELLGYMEDAAKAIDFLNSPVHQLESGVGAIGHCDIKPLNVLIVGGGAQVCDFGLAHIVGAARSTAAAMGTIAYVAPELLEGKPSPATDQYCLAISYYELRTGLLPYAQETASAVMKAVIDGDLDFSKLPDAEQAVLRHATAKGPGDRFASAMEMVAALREATAAGKPAPRRKGSRTAALLKALGAVVLLGVVGLGVWLGASEDGRNRLRQLFAGAGNGGRNGGEPGKETPGKQKLPEDGRSKQGQAKDAAATVAELLSQAADLAAKSDWQSALGKYDEALAIDPANRQALLMRAKCSLRLKQYDDALAYLRKVQPPDPDVARAFLQEFVDLGEEALKKESWDSARDALRRALEVDPQNVRALILIAQACLGHDLPDDALTHLDLAIQLDPRSADAYFFRGRAYLKKQQYDKARADFERLMQDIDPDNRLGYASRKEYGEAYLELGKATRDQAQRLRTEAADSNDEKKTALARAKTQEAIDLFSKGIRHDAKNALLYSRRGTSLLQSGKLDEAVEDLAKAIEFGTQDVDKDLFYRGYVYERQAAQQKSAPQAWTDLLKKAQADFMAAGKKNPRNADADYLLAECCMQLGDYKGAIAPYDNAIKKHDAWPDPWFGLKNAYYYRASCHLFTGGLKQAADDFSHALALPGEFPAEPAGTAQVFHKLAVEFAKLKQFTEAIQWNQKAIELMPDEATRKQYRSAEKAWKGEEF